MTDFELAQRQFREYYDSNIELLRDAEASIRTQILSVLADHPSFMTPHVVSRIKAREECISKFQRKYLPRLAEAKACCAIQHHIVDLIGIRVICLFVPDIKEIVGRLETEFDVLDITDKAREVEITADAFRYKGVHLAMALSARRRSLPACSRFSSLRFEVQVRTIIQDAWSTLDQAIKYKKEVPHELCRRINALAALFEVADREFLAIKNQLSEFTLCRLSSVTPTIDGRTSTALDVLPVLHCHVQRFQVNDQKHRGLVAQLQSRGSPMNPADFDDGSPSGVAELDLHRDRRSSG